MRRSAIIVAGGQGSRMGTEVPKQFLLLKGEPLLFHCIRAFHSFDARMDLVVVLPEQHHVMWQEMCVAHTIQRPHMVVAGGQERFHSVKAGLEQLTGEGIVAVHDGVRPLVTKELIARCFSAAEEHGAAVPVIPVPSSMREIDGDGSRALDRNRLRIVQTPQCFRMPLLKEAFGQPYDPSFTDEATLVERMGTRVHLVDGDERNLKITTRMDMLLADALAVGTRKPGSF